MQKVLSLKGRSTAATARGKESNTKFEREGWLSWRDKRRIMKPNVPVKIFTEK